MARSSSQVTLNYAAPKKSDWAALVAPLLRFSLALGGALVLVACLLFGLLSYTHRDRKVADIPGPSAAAATYELWYNLYGDLMFRPATGAWQAKALDYYESRVINKTNWLDSDNLEVTTNEGTVFKIRLSARTLQIDYSNFIPMSQRAMTQPSSQPRGR